MNARLRQPWFSGTAIVLSTTFANVASATAPEDARMAQALFEEARTLMKAGDFARACPMLEESQRRDPGGGTLLNLALCHEQQGKVATAWSEFNDAYAQASRDRRSEREKIAKDHLDALGPRLPKITIRVPKSSPDEKVTLDGSPVNSAAYGVPLPVDPGDHVVAASAPDRQNWSTQVTAKEKAVAEVSVPDLGLAPGGTIEVLGAAGPTDSPARMNALEATRVHTVVRFQQEPAPPRNPWRTMLVITGTLGLVGATVAGSLVMVNGIEYKNAKCNTGRSYCPDQDGIDAADNARLWSIVALGSLGVAVASFIALPFLPDDSPTTLAVGPGSATLLHRF